MTPGGLFGRLLRRRAPGDAAAVDQDVVRQLRGLGADLTRPRHVRHFLYFEEEGFARRAAEQIESRLQRNRDRSQRRGPGLDGFSPRAFA
jgi:hypothetical protein